MHIDNNYSADPVFMLSGLVWQQSHTYAKNTCVIPSTWTGPTGSTYNNNLFCTTTVNGTTGGAEPNWANCLSPALGSDTSASSNTGCVDNTVTWYDVGPGEWSDTTGTGSITGNRISDGVPYGIVARMDTSTGLGYMGPGVTIAGNTFQSPWYYQIWDLASGSSVRDNNFQGSYNGNAMDSAGSLLRIGDGSTGIGSVEVGANSYHEFGSATEKFLSLAANTSGRALYDTNLYAIGKLSNGGGWQIDVPPTLTVRTGTAGTATCMETEQGTVKRASCYLNGYQETGSAQSFNYPTAFSTTPVILEQASGTATGGSEGSCGTYHASTSTTLLTLPANAGMSAETCNVVLMGQ